jgi:cell division protein FtsA
LASESLETEVVCIPGLRGHAPKEITLRNLASIIQARMEEIIEHVHYEIVNSGYEKKLIAGIVVTGGGAQLKHVTQLFEYMTGMTTRIGLPTEHLASTNTIEAITSPTFATGIGLVMKGFEKDTVHKVVESAAGQVKGHSTKSRGSFFDTLLTKSKNFFAEEE